MPRLVNCVRSLFQVVALFGALVLPSVVFAEPASPPPTQNRLLAITPEGSGDAISVKLVTEKPLGYRYTVYDSFDPVRVVIDLPTTDISSVAPQQVVGDTLLKEIRASRFDVKSGSLGRIELLLAGSAEYKVTVEESELRVIFLGSKGAGQAAVAASSDETATVSPELPAAAISAPVDVPVAVPSSPAKTLTQVDVAPGMVLLKTDGAPGVVKQFTLKSPNRLVVDIFGIKPAIKERSFKAKDGFDKVRLGVYSDKVRFVFDASSGKMPQYSVEPIGDTVRVLWGANALAGAYQPMGSTAQISAAARTSGAQVAIEGVDFKVEDGKSLLLVSLSEPAVVSAPVIEGNILRFEVGNARISQNLRRVIDASSFPSVVRQITPYVFMEKGKQNVRFSVQTKGTVPYEFKRDGKVVILALENGQFTEAMPSNYETRALPVPEPLMSQDTYGSGTDSLRAISGSMSGFTAQPVTATMSQGGGKEKVYTGQKVTLEFDNADIRNIIQLIAEVSELNIIVNDDVKGTITLRLINVPWDQALALILETKGLGMMQEGNVVRVMTQKEMQVVRLEKLKDSVAIEDNEPAVTKVFVVKYAPINDIASKIQAHLGKSGDSGTNSVTSDPRTRQIIVTARPSRLLQIEEELLKRLDVPERQVMIEARIVEANSSFGNDLGVKWGLSYNDPNSSIPRAGVEAGGGGAFMTLPKTAGVVSGAAGLSSGITFGNLLTDTTILDLRISALESSGNGKVVSTPRITTLNGGEASISQGTKIPYQSSGTDGPKTEFVDANLELKVTPVINPDDTIVLDITATNSNIGGFVPTGTGDAPSVNTKEAKTRVLVKNGETTVIGGIFVENETDGESGVPILMNIPILGHLFKTSNVTKGRSELLIFITPRILD